LASKRGLLNGLALILTADQQMSCYCYQHIIDWFHLPSCSKNIHFLQVNSYRLWHQQRLKGIRLKHFIKIHILNVYRKGNNSTHDLTHDAFTRETILAIINCRDVTIEQSGAICNNSPVYFGTTLLYCLDWKVVQKIGNW
jgi:hypothetical protein